MNMAAAFNFVGKLRKLKDNGYEEKEFSGGLIRKRLQFQMICGDNTQWLEVSALVWKDDKKNKIYTFRHVENGKDEKVEVEWANRFDPDIVKSVAGYRVWTIDTDTWQNRKELEEAGKDEELEASQKKRKEFLHQSDFIDHLQKVLNSEKSKDMIFRVTGSVEFSYSQKKDAFYRSFIPQKITRVVDETEQACSGSMKVYFSEGAVDDTMADETGNIIFNCYTQYYDTNLKANAFTPISFVINKDAKKAKGFKKLFNKAEDEEVKELGVVVDFINGSSRVEITEDMLTDEQKELIEMEMTTLEEIKAELGGSVYGDRVTETRLTGLMRGYSGGVLETVFTPDDLVRKPIKVEEKEEATDIFNEDEDDEI
jgi:hypothetical protein